MYTHGTTSPFPPSTSDRLLSPLTIQVISLPLLCRNYQQTLEISCGTWPTVLLFLRTATAKSSWMLLTVHWTAAALLRCRETTKLCKRDVHEQYSRSWKTSSGGLILETNCIFEYKPSPHFRLNVVYTMGGHIDGTLWYCHGKNGRPKIGSPRN